MNEPGCDPKWTVDIDAIESCLLGTCQSLHEVTDCPDLVEVMLGERNNIECCDQCSWWCETSEMDEDNVCEDCRN